MSVQYNHFSNTTANGHSILDSNKLLTIIKQHPIKLLLIFLAFGSAIAAYIYYSTTTTYACRTATIDNHSICEKYKISPPPVELIGIVSNSACPNNPPSNCP